MELYLGPELWFGFFGELIVTDLAEHIPTRRKLRAAWQGDPLDDGTECAPDADVRRKRNVRQDCHGIEETQCAPTDKKVSSQANKTGKRHFLEGEFKRRNRRRRTTRAVSLDQSIESDFADARLVLYGSLQVPSTKSHAYATWYNLLSLGKAPNCARLSALSAETARLRLVRTDWYARQQET